MLPRFELPCLRGEMLFWTLLATRSPTADGSGIGDLLADRLLDAVILVLLASASFSGPRTEFDLRIRAPRIRNLLSP